MFWHHEASVFESELGGRHSVAFCVWVPVKMHLNDGSASVSRNVFTEQHQQRLGAIIVCIGQE